MKKLIIIFLLCTVKCFGQGTCKVNCAGAGDIRADTTLRGNSTNELCVDTAIIATNIAVRDSILAHAGGGGTVTSIATTSGILGGTITTSGTLKADTGLLATNTAVHDSILAHPSGTGTVTSVATGYGLSGGTITTSGTLLVDSATLSNTYLRTKDSTIYATLYRNSLKLNISDTSGMLGNYLRSATAAATYATITSLNLKTDSVKRAAGNDSIFYYTNGTKHFCCLDSVGVTGTGTVTSVSAGYGMAFTTITSSGAAIADTSILVNKIGNQTLTNKTISGAANTLTNIPNSSLLNSAVTVSAGIDLTGGGAVSLGSSVTLNADTTKLATQNYVGRQGFGTGTVTSVATRAPITGGTITSTGTIALNKTAIDSLGTIVVGVWQGTSIDTAYTNAVSKVSAGIDITVGTGGKSYTVNADTTTGAGKLATQGFVSRTYQPISGLGSMAFADSVKFVGNTNIFKLGTITTGVWHGTVLDTIFGGSNSSNTKTGRINTGNATVVDGFQALGSAIIGETYDPALISSSNGLTSGAIYYLYLGNNISGTVSGAKFYLTTQGAYTNTRSTVALFSETGGTLTCVDSSLNNASLFKGTSGTFTSQAFNTTYQATYGTHYFLAIFYSATAITTPPQIGYFAFTNMSITTFDFANSLARSINAAGATAIPTSVAASTLTPNINFRWGAIY